MTLHHYFKPISSKLPDPNGLLSKEIGEANKGVEQSTKIGTARSLAEDNIVYLHLHRQTRLQSLPLKMGTKKL